VMKKKEENVVGGRSCFFFVAFSLRIEHLLDAFPNCSEVKVQFRVFLLSQKNFSLRARVRLLELHGYV